MAGKTTHYKLTKPVIGGDESIWGSALNANFDAIDTTFYQDRTDLNYLGGAVTDLHARIDSLLNYFFPIGTVLGTTNNVNPETRFAGTRWVPYAAGRAPVGVGTADGVSWGGRTERGAATHTLSLNEAPAHAHSQGNQSGTTGQANRAHRHKVFDQTGFDGGNAGGDPDGFGERYGAIGIRSNEGGDKWTDEAGNDHTHFVTVGGGTTDVRGGGQPHNNIQPSIGTYFWERVG